jgi:DNA-binding winged helix-turn-helix (wHTH) protein
MTPSIESALRAKLHRIIDEVFSATVDDSGATSTAPSQRAEHLIERLRSLSPEMLEEPGGEFIEVGELRIDLAGHEVFAAGRRIRLTHREFALLRHLAVHRGRACVREDIVAAVWSDRSLATGRTVDIHVHRLRQKLGSPFIELVETLRNVGYKLRAAPLTRETRARRPQPEAILLAVREVPTRSAFPDPPGNLTASLAGLRE